VLREMYLGARRFDQIQGVLRLPRSTLSDRLARLTEAEVIERAPSGAGSRFEYRLSERGLDLYLVMLSMLRFGDDWLAGGKDPPLELVHAPCGNRCHPLSVCSSCREPIEAVRVSYRDGPGAGSGPAPDLPQRRRFAEGDHYERGRPSSVSRTLQMIGDRWTFLVLREAFFGVKRFDSLQARLGISPKTLADRLSRLVSQGILRKCKYQDHPGRYEYRLTDMGRALYLPMVEMLRWGDRWISGKPPLILTHLDCGNDFLPLMVCDHCRAPLHAREMRYRLNYPPVGADRPGPPARLPSPT
jgi:DNA-binding HxlR family transcriptional regulator